MGKLFILGLDGIGLSVLEAIQAHSLMPTFTEWLRSSSAHGELTSTVPPFTPPAWTSIATGLTPEAHGVLDFFAHPGNSERQVSHLPSGTFWEIASAQGKRVGVFNYPLSYPPRPVNGYFVSGMLTPPNVADGYYPPSIKPLLDEFQIDLGYRITAADSLEMQMSSSRLQLVEQITALMRSHIITSWKLLNTAPAEIAIHVFTATDRFLHYFWDFMESPESITEPIRTQCYAFWRMLDDAFARILALCSPEDYLVVVSDHGFGRSPIARLNVDLWASKAGFKRVNIPVTLRGRLYSTLARRRVLRALVKTVVPRKALLNVRLSSLAKQISQYETIDGVTFRLLHTSVVGCWVDAKDGQDSQNLKEKVEYVQQTLEKSAREIRLTNGAPIITSVSHWHHSWPSQGHRVANGIPNLIIQIDEKYGAVIGSLDRRLLIPFEHSGRSGDHRSDSIIAIMGPGIAGPIEFKEPVGRVWDIAALVLYFAGLSIPEQWDAKVLEQVIDSRVIANYPPTYTPGWVLGQAEEDTGNSSLSQQDIDFVEERLRNLGYIE